MASLTARMASKLSKTASARDGSEPTATKLGAVGRWAPALGGSALAFIGLSRRSPVGAALAVAGGALAYGGLTGKAPLPDWLRSRFPRADGQGFEVERALTVQYPREEVYAFWRNFENLPRFMGYLEAVTITGEGRSHWVAKGPVGTTIEWEAEIVEERPNELIRWQSLPGAQVANRGVVRFEPAPGNRGTEVRVKLTYDPPGGQIGATLAQVFGQGADRQVRESLRNFKHILETGEIPTNDNQPMGRCLKA